jgi:tetratricopeptide (TPR) repeat protein
MKAGIYWISAAAVVLSFVGGFLVANSINRREINELTAENERLKSDVASGNNSNSGPSLSADEIRASIEKADQDPGNAVLQKNLGLALYRYGVIKNDPDLVSESARILERALDLSTGDYDVLVGLGNAYFDIGYFRNDNSSLLKAREIYLQALARKPEDDDVRVDVGITYFLESPPDDAKAVAEFRKALDRNPRHRKALEFMVQALRRQGDVSEAAKFAETLGKLNSNGAASMPTGIPNMSGGNSQK